MSLGFGALPDDDDPRDRRYIARDLVGATPVKASAMGLVDKVYTHPKLGWPNQRWSSACCGYGTTQTVYTYLRSLGGEPKAIMGSPLATYFHAVARGVGWENVTDDGSKPRHAWESLREFGLVPFDKWPRISVVSSWDDVARFAAKQPDPDCYRESIDYDWLRYHWIMSYGAECKRDMQKTLSAGRPFAASFTLGEDFRDWTGIKGPYKRKAAIAGYHYMACVGYEAQGVWCANSHGIEFGQLGYILMSWDTMTSAETRSKAVPEINTEVL